MTQWEKLLKKIRLLSPNIRFNELKKILEPYGYTMRGTGSGGSHYTFRKAGKYPITIPKNEPIKVAYVLLVRKIIEEELEDENY